MNRILYGCGKGSAPGVGTPALRRSDIMCFAKRYSLSPPNQIFVDFIKSCQRTGSESMIALQAFETREARARVEKGRKLKILDTSSLGRRVIKSRDSVGVSTDWSVRRTGNGECRRNVRRTCDCKGGGKAEKWFRRVGRVISVVRATSG